MNAKLIDLQNDVIKKVVDIINTDLVEDEMDGNDAHDVAMNMADRFHNLQASHEFEQWAKFTRRFTRCIDAGGGCDHDDDQHYAIITVFEMGML